MGRKHPSARARTGEAPQLRNKLEQIMRAVHAGMLPQARAGIRPLLNKHPSVPEVNHVASGIHAALNEGERALYYARRAVELAPERAEYHASLGAVLARTQQYDEASEALTRALKLDPALNSARVTLATVQMESGRIAPARENFRAALDRDPKNLEAANNLALLESDLGHADRAVRIIENALSHHPEHPLLLDALCMFACYSDTLTPEQVAHIHRRFGRSVESRVRPASRFPNDPDPNRRIRVGFVSPDLRRHSIVYFLRPIVERLDRQRFEVCLYHTSRKGDGVTRALREACDLWRDCHEGIARTHKQISADRVDILVELNGHFAGNLLPMFAARPAPVSVTMIGYANTTGLRTIDARLIDDITDPKPQADPWATEELVRIPGCFLCYRPPEDAPDTREPDPRRPFTFGSFNDLRKVSPATLRTWATILKRCPDARLVLKTPRLGDPAAREELLDRLAELGVGGERVQLLGRIESLRDHLELYNGVDCALDTFPYAGTTTTCEATHMGVPTVTLMGRSHAGRVGASLLTALGMTQHIARDTDEYIRIACEAHERGTLPRAQRQSIREQLARSPLRDEQAYTLRVAEAFSSLWRKWCSAQGNA